MSAENISRSVSAAGVMRIRCKECRRAQDRERYRADPSKTLAKAARWRDQNRNRIGEITKRSRIKRFLNPEVKRKHFERRKTQASYQRASKKTSAKSRAILRDSYIKPLLKSAGIKKEDITPEMIDFYRENLRLKRLIKSKKDAC